MKPLDLVKSARRLVPSAQKKRPRQSDLKRAISTSYYALFHQICENCADCLIGGKQSDRSAPAWRQAYRAIKHSHAKNQCKNKRVLSKFPKEIEDFATVFFELQVERHRADYDPFARFTKTEAITAINTAEDAIRAFKRAPIKDRRAFAAWTAMDTRPD